MDPLDTKRKEEYNIIKSLEGDIGKYYVLPYKWMGNWIKFVRDNGERPGIINVNSLLDSNGNLKPTFRFNVDYMLINEKQWKFFLNNYMNDGEYSTTDKTIAYSTSRSLSSNIIPNRPNFDAKKTYNLSNLNNNSSSTEDSKKSVEKSVKQVLTNTSSRYTEDVQQVPKTTNKNLLVVNKPNKSIEDLQQTPKTINKNAKPLKDLDVAYNHIQTHTNNIKITSTQSPVFNKPLNLHPEPQKKTTKKPLENLSRPQSPARITPTKASVIPNARLSAIEGTLKCARPLFGLENPRFQCYLNTVLQCLLSLTDLLFYISTLNSNSQLLSFLSSAFQAKSSKTQSAKALVSMFRQKFPPSAQHDAPEFFRSLLERLNTELGDNHKPLGTDAWSVAKSKYSKGISDNILGLFCSTVECLACRTKSYLYEPFTMLILSVQDTIEEAILSFKAKEGIKAQYKCEKCRAKKDIIKFYTFSVLPKYLIVQLKRFKWNPRPRKIDSVCKFKTRLRIVNCDNLTVEYMLIAVGVHTGSPDAGHYYAYVYRNSWYCVNDESVTEVSENVVVSSQAYLLVYQTIN